jgi:hypothetical protein
MTNGIDPKIYYTINKKMASRALFQLSRPALAREPVFNLPGAFSSF